MCIQAPARFNIERMIQNGFLIPVKWGKMPETTGAGRGEIYSPPKLRFLLPVKEYIYFLVLLCFLLMGGFPCKEKPIGLTSLLLCLWLFTDCMFLCVWSLGGDPNQTGINISVHFSCSSGPLVNTLAVFDKKKYVCLH